MDHSTTDELCLVCRQLNFRAMFDAKCSTCSPPETSTGIIIGRQPVQIGSLQRISSTTSCPLCRLVSICISFYSKWLPPTVEIRLAGELVHMGPSPVSATGYSQYDPKIYGISIKACGLAIESSLRQASGARRFGEHFPIGVGTLLPVSPCYNEEYIASRTAYSGSTTERTCYAYARPVTPWINTGLVQRWGARCIGEHQKCLEFGFSTLAPQANIRVIDVKERRVVLHNRNCKYIALSYVWGPSTKGLMARSTLEKYALAGSLDQEDVPLTIRDTIGLVADLGERYLWVDSLCIVQDDLEDKRKYLPMMGEIYNAALFVIIAAVENAHSGLPGRGNCERRHPRVIERIQGMDFTIAQPELRDYLATTTWNLRGWTYQEAHLARRALVITDFQVYWSCHEESWCEDRFTEFPNPGRYLMSYNSLFVGPTGLYPPLGHFASRSYLCSFGEYCQTARELSTRSFSDQRDILWALLGILQSQLSKFPQGYIWAMPKNKLDASLLWQTDKMQHLSHEFAIPVGTGKWQRLAIPSWCWISKGTGIWYDECYESVLSMIEWDEPVHMGKPGALSAGQGDEEEERARNLQSVISQSDQIFSQNPLFDFALLRFTAESAVLKIHSIIYEGPQPCISFSILSATIGLLSGEDIGSIRVPIRAFCGKDEMFGEFILLSAMTKEDEDFLQESEEPTYNIMLVSRSDDKRFASRVTWTGVPKSAWEKCERQRKTIILQ